MKKKVENEKQNKTKNKGINMQRYKKGKKKENYWNGEIDKFQTRNSNLINFYFYFNDNIFDNKL